jgi:hypothetical protein
MMTDEHTHAHANPQTPQPNPALKHLDVLVGEWKIEISAIAFLADPSTRVRGQPLSNTKKESQQIRWLSLFFVNSSTRLKSSFQPFGLLKRPGIATHSLAYS